MTDTTKTTTIFETDIPKSTIDAEKFIVNEKNEKNEQDSSDSEDDESEQDYMNKSIYLDDLNLDLESFNYTDNSSLYVVSLDGVPQFYVKDKKVASDKMWGLTRLLSLEKISSGYRTNYLKVGDNQLNLVGSYRFFLLAYDQILHSVSYHKIKECV